MILCEDSLDTYSVHLYSLERRQTTNGDDNLVSHPILRSERGESVALTCLASFRRSLPNGCLAHGRVLIMRMSIPSANVISFRAIPNPCHPPIIPPNPLITEHHRPPHPEVTVQTARFHFLIEPPGLGAGDSRCALLMIIQAQCNDAGVQTANLVTREP